MFRLAGKASSPSTGAACAARASPRQPELRTCAKRPWRTCGIAHCRMCTPRALRKPRPGCGSRRGWRARR
eukprot:12658216-Alexandrium_andersonii.AAC.1